MFGHLDNFYDEDETLDVLKRYREMLVHHSSNFFDLDEFECIIDYFVDQFNYRDAVKAATLAIKQHPYASFMKLKYVQLLIETGKPAKALGIIKSISDSESSNFEFFLAKGIALNLTGKHIEAQSEFKRAIQLCDENKDEVAYNIAQSYMQIGMASQAVRYLLQAYRYNEDNILVLYDLALNYEKLDCPEKSILYYNKYLELDPFAEHVWNNLGLLYAELDDFDKACEAFDLAIAINPDYLGTYFNKADMMVINNKIQDAIRVYTDLLILDGSNTKALCDLGNCYEETGNYQKALQCFHQALAVSKDCSEAWYGSGMINYRQKKFKQSILSFKKAASIQPSNSDYWFMLGEAYAGMRKLDQAINAYSKASELNPLDFEAWTACAQVLFRKKRIGEAIRMLTQLYQYNYDNPTINYRLAAYCLYLGDHTSALRYFEKGLSLNFQEYKEMFRRFPKAKSYLDFQRLVEHHSSHNEYYKRIQ